MNAELKIIARKIALTIIWAVVCFLVTVSFLLADLANFFAHEGYARNFYMVRENREFNADGKLIDGEVPLAIFTTKYGSISGLTRSRYWPLEILVRILMFVLMVLSMLRGFRALWRPSAFIIDKLSPAFLFAPAAYNLWLIFYLYQVLRLPWNNDLELLENGMVVHLPTRSILDFMLFPATWEYVRFGTTISMASFLILVVLVSLKIDKRLRDRASTQYAL